MAGSSRVGEGTMATKRAREEPATLLGFRSIGLHGVVHGCRGRCYTPTYCASDQAQTAARCPFAGVNSFLAAKDGRSMDRYGGHVSPISMAGGSEWATPHTWLEAGVSGQPTPGRLVAGLRQLHDLDEFIIAVPAEMPGELAAKARALDDTARRDKLLVAEPDSVDAQRECLELLLSYLPSRYPELYSLSGSAADGSLVLMVHPTGDRYTVSDFARCPLELAARVVQEDLVLMCPTEEERNQHSRENMSRHRMAAACVIFSFAGLSSKLSGSLSLLHAPVPGFEEQLLPLVNRMFDGLRPDKPLWRNNWGIADSGDLDSPLYGDSEAAAGRSLQPLLPQRRWLRTEYQTLRRLPRTKAALFTVRTFTEPLSALAGAPAAAAAIAASLRGMSPPMQAYKGLGDLNALADMLEYLDTMANNQNVTKGRKEPRSAAL